MRRSTLKVAFSDCPTTVMEYGLVKHFKARQLPPMRLKSVHIVAPPALQAPNMTVVQSELDAANSAMCFREDEECSALSEHYLFEGHNEDLAEMAQRAIEEMETNQRIDEACDWMMN